MATTTGSKRLLNISGNSLDASNSMTYGGLNVATEQYVSTQISNIISSAPGLLDTLNELAAALGDDPNFATTMTNALAGKLSTGHDMTLTLSGDASGSATFTNMGNATLSVVVANDSHTHDGRYYTETEVNSLLAGKLSTSGKAADSNLLDGLNSTAYMRDNGWNSSPGQDADTQPGMSSDFSYGNNAPHTGDLIRFGSSSYSLQLSSAYNSNTGALSFRTRNGDAGAWNDWREIFHNGNLSLSVLGYTGATNANYITNNNQLTNGAGYTTNTGTITGVSTGTGLDGTASSGSVTITLDLSELTDMTAAVVPTADEVILLDNGAERKKLFSEIFGSAAYVNTGSFDAAGAADTVNNRIDSEIIGLIDGKADSGHNHSGVYLPVAGKAADSEKVDGINGASLLRSDANDSFSGALTSSVRNNGIFGTYDSTKTDHIWGMGTGYKSSSTGADFGNLYGIAYKHTNNTTGGTMAGGHQAVFVNNGSPGVAIGFSGTVWTSNHGDSGQWNTAYGWGNHASAGYITNNISTGLTINGSLSRGTYTSASNYKTGADNIVLKGNSVGRSGIFFESEKDGVNINHTSDFGFIQYHAYGTSTTGESNELIIGVSNDGDDHLIFNAPNIDGMKFRVGTATTDNTVYHSGNLTLATLGYTGATNANNITNNNQLTNGASYLTTSGKAADSNLLDGINSTSFLRSDANDTHAGTLALTAITAAAGTIANTKGSYLHIGAWGTSRTAADAVLVNTAYRSDILSYTRSFTIGSTARNFNGSANVSWSLADIGAEAAGSAAAVDARIDNEVLPAIPTNNNQLTNGAAYLTSVPSTFTTAYVTATGYIKGGGQQLVLSAGESHNYATGQTGEYIYMNAEQGIEVNSETGNWNGGWAARKTAYLRGDQLTLDGEALTKTNIQNFKTAYNNYITGVSVTGTTTKTITLTQRDGGTISDTFTDLSGAGGDGNDFLASGSFDGGTEILTLEVANQAPIEISLSGVMTDNNTTYSVGDGGLTTKNFTAALKTKLDGIEAGATADQDLSGYLTTSGKAADSNLLDGLDLHTGRNNEANKVVRTDSNGYIQAGWINTPSGAAGTINRIYASQDNYVRYLTPANFRTQVTDAHYDAAGSAGAVDSRIDNEVLPAIGAITLSSLGYTGAANANYITNNSQLTNGAGYITGVATYNGGTGDGLVPGHTIPTSIDQDYFLNGAGSWSIPPNDNDNTTYSAGTGLDLTGTTFSIEPDLRDGITKIGKDTSNYIAIDADNNNSIDFYISGVWVARMEADGDLHMKGDVIAFSDIFNP